MAPMSWLPKRAVRPGDQTDPAYQKHYAEDRAGQKLASQTEGAQDDQQSSDDAENARDITIERWSSARVLSRSKTKPQPIEYDSKSPSVQGQPKPNDQWLGGNSDNENRRGEQYFTCEPVLPFRVRVRWIVICQSS
jgi:hypothetical protein